MEHRTVKEHLRRFQERGRWLDRLMLHGVWVGVVALDLLLIWRGAFTLVNGWAYILGGALLLPLPAGWTLQYITAVRLNHLLTKASLEELKLAPEIHGPAVLASLKDDLDSRFAWGAAISAVASWILLSGILGFQGGSRFSVDLNEFFMAAGFLLPFRHYLIWAVCGYAQALMLRCGLSGRSADGGFSRAAISFFLRWLVRVGIIMAAPLAYILMENLAIYGYFKFLTNEVLDIVFPLLALPLIGSACYLIYLMIAIPVKHKRRALAQAAEALE